MLERQLVWVQHASVGVQVRKAVGRACKLRGTGQKDDWYDYNIY